MLLLQCQSSLLSYFLSGSCIQTSSCPDILPNLQANPEAGRNSTRSNWYFSRGLVQHKYVQDQIPTQPGTDTSTHSLCSFKGFPKVHSVGGLPIHFSLRLTQWRNSFSISSFKLSQHLKPSWKLSSSSIYFLLCCFPRLNHR